MDPSEDGSSTSRPRPSARSRRSDRASRTSGSPGSEPTRLGVRTLRALAERHGIRPSKDLGQHFLTDPNLAEAIVTAAEIAPGDRVLEIGAGLGSLTRPLAERAAHVMAMEFDRALLPALREVVSDLANVEVIQADAVSAPWQELLAGERWSVVANLPYNVAVPILLRLLEGSPKVHHYVVMVQEEVAERLSAGPGAHGYGPTSLRIAYRAEAEILRSVPPTVFWPRPHVGSSVLRLRPHPGPDGVDAAALFHVIDVAFAERRKTMRSALRRLGVPASRVAEVLRSAEIDPNARPESLPLERFATVAERIDSEAADDADG